MYLEVPPARLVPNPGQPRRHFDESALDELAASLRASGMLAPIVARPVEDGLMIVAGERRWRASLRADLVSVPVRVVDLDEADAYVLSVAENVNRAEMTLMEEARAYATLVGMGKTPTEVGALFGKTPTYVTWRLGLLGLIGPAAEAVEMGAMGPNVGYQVAKLSPAGQHVVLARYMRGEFPTEQDASDFAQAVLARESQECLFGEAEDEDAKAERIERRRKARSVIDRLADAGKVLEQVAAYSPTDLADALSGEVATHAAKVEDVAALAIKARGVMRKARAAALASSP